MEDEELNGMIVDSSGYIKFYVDGYLHREDGSAVISPKGIQYWLIKDRLHREDGPAIVSITLKVMKCRSCSLCCGKFKTFCYERN